LPVNEYTALQVKQAVVGHGKAAKEQVQDMVRRLLTLPGTRRRTPPMRSPARSRMRTTRRPRAPRRQRNARSRRSRRLTSEARCTRDAGPPR
jgi:hypothetical protein